MRANDSPPAAPASPPASAHPPRAVDASAAGAGAAGGEFRVSATGTARHWRGTICRGRRAVWTCPHVHTNRDDEYAQHSAAKKCAAAVLAALADRARSVAYLESLRRAAGGMSQQVGSARAIERTEWALGVADEIRASLIGGAP